MTLEPGTRLGPYEIVDLRGKGGMGEVYRARDVHLERDVAIKVLPEDFADNADRLARFEREAKAIAALNHPNVATVHGFERVKRSNTDERVSILVMELLEGETLAERIARGPIPVEEAIPLFVQIAEGLAAAHEKGIVHRDLKPSNVNVTGQERVKVLDFGLAKATAEEPVGSDGNQSTTLTAAGATPANIILGTAAYMSPEQAKGNPVDSRADVWAFGVCLWEALTGRPAFSGEGVADTLAAVLRGEVDWQELPRVPTSLERTLRRCLERQPHERLQHLGDARLDLQEALESESGRESQNEHRRPIATAILVATTLAVGAGSAWLWLQRSPASISQQAVTRFTIPLPDDLTIDPVNGPALQLSPDGRTLLIRGRPDQGIERQAIYVRTLDTLELVRLASTRVTSDFAAAFSPDGRWLASTDEGRLVKIRIDGGARVELCDTGTAVDGLLWLDESTLILGSRAAPLRTVAADGGEPVALSKLDEANGEKGHLFPAVLPGGKSLVFEASTVGGFQLAAMRLRDPTSHRVLRPGATPTFVAPGFLVFSLRPSLTNQLWAGPFDPDRLEFTGESEPILTGIYQQRNSPPHFAAAPNGTLAYYPAPTITEGGTDRLVWVDRQGNEGALPLDPGRYTRPRLSPDGGQLAFTRDDEETLILDLERGGVRRLTGDNNVAAVWSPDGERMAISRVGASGLMSMLAVSASSPAEAEVLAASPWIDFPYSFTPDGRSLLHLRIRDSWDLYLLDLETNESRPLLAAEGVQEGRGMISPNGRWLAYESDESGRFEIYLQPFPNGTDERELVSVGGGRLPLWRRDGGELFYVSGSELVSVSFNEDELPRLGRPTVLFGGNFGFDGPDYDVSHDGQRFLMVKKSGQPSRQPEPVVVIGWGAEIEGLLAKDQGGVASR